MLDNSFKMEDRQNLYITFFVDPTELYKMNYVLILPILHF